MEKYPILTVPCFVHGSDTPWAGTMLRDAFLKDTPEDATGESLEVSVFPGLESTVANGAHAGATLTALAAAWGEGLTGACNNFPFGIKLLDAAACTPETACEYARTWVILNTEPGAQLIFSGNTVEPKPGNIYYIPGGITAAMCGGIQVYEACAGHAAPATCGFMQTEGATVLCKGGSRTYYVCDNSLELCRLNVSGNMPLPKGRMLAITPVAPCTLYWENGEMLLNPFETVIIPAGLQVASVCGMLKIFMACVSDQPALKQELGYRADSVAGLL